MDALTIASSEPLRIRAYPSGRFLGKYAQYSPDHGLVTIKVMSGPSKGQGVTLNHNAATRFARALRDPVKAALDHDLAKVVRVTHGDTFVSVERGVRTESKHWWRIDANPEVDRQVAREQLAAAVGVIADAITIAARQAEQDIPAVSQRIAQDHAEMARGGFPLGLTRDPRILDEARKIHDMDLGRMGPSRLKTSIALPIPSLVQHEEDPINGIRRQVASMDKKAMAQLLRALQERFGG